MAGRMVVFFALLLFACAAPAFGEAQPSTVNVDELPHLVQILPNGAKVEVIVYQEHNWRVVDVSVLSGSNDQDPDVCFENKFDTLAPPDRLKLLGIAVAPSPKERQWASIILDERLKRRAQKDFQRGENLWICGTLRKAGPRDLELAAVEVVKLPPDLQRYEMDIERRRKVRDGEGLVELGHKIKQLKVTGIEDFDKLTALSDRAFDAGLSLKEEKALKGNDGDALFAVALQWRELRNKMAKFRELVGKCLDLDPKHPKARRVAEEEWGYVEFEGKMRGKTEVEKIMKERQETQAHLAAVEKAAQEAREKTRKHAAENRTALLVAHQAALRTGEAKARERAVLGLGEDIAKSLDPGFGEEGVEILVNLTDPAAVPALQAAGKNESADVRRGVFEALAWRGGRQDKAALDALSAALVAERDVPAARGGVGAAAALGGKAAAAVLVACLGNPSGTVQDDVIEALKTATKQQLNSKQEWQDWWNKNKGSFNPN